MITMQLLRLNLRAESAACTQAGEQLPPLFPMTSSEEAITGSGESASVLQNTEENRKWRQDRSVVQLAGARACPCPFRQDLRCLRLDGLFSAMGTDESQDSGSGFEFIFEAKELRRNILLFLCSLRRPET